jgi:hypothetical protein
LVASERGCVMAIVYGDVRFEATPRRMVNWRRWAVPMPPKVVITGVGSEPVTTLMVSSGGFVDFYRRVWLPAMGVEGV